MIMRRWWWWGRRRWAALALCAGALYAAARLCAPAELLTDARFPNVRPAALAHMLADFSTHPLPERGTWSIEEESSNYTSWRYKVAYECGARCAGRAVVEAYERSPHASGPEAHRVLVRHSYCIAIPLLPWPNLCGEWETETMVTSMENGVGALLRERARAKCVGAGAPLAALLGDCGDARLLHARRNTHLQLLRQALTAAGH